MQAYRHRNGKLKGVPQKGVDYRFSIFYDSMQIEDRGKDITDIIKERVPLGHIDLAKSIVSYSPDYFESRMRQDPIVKDNMGSYVNERGYHHVHLEEAKDILIMFKKYHDIDFFPITIDNFRSRN